MTTIAYHKESGIIAVDGQVTSGDIIAKSDYDKCIVRNGFTFILCGSIADGDELIRCFLNEEKPEVELSAAGMMVAAGVVYRLFMHDGKPTKQILNYNWAMGSGMEFALAALDHGKSAYEAVAYASSRDLYTNGNISEHLIEDMT